MFKYKYHPLPSKAKSYKKYIMHEWGVVELEYGFTWDVIMNIGIGINQYLVGKDWLKKRGHPTNPASA